MAEERELAHFPHLWYQEFYTGNNMGLFIKVKRIVYTKQTKYQRIDIFDTYDLGRVFALDGITMTTDLDEFMYHEMLVHVPMFLHPNPRKVLIIGGGDGGSLREVLKHESVEKAILCEIDPDVIEAARKYLKTSVEFDNPKAEIINENGAEFVRKFKGEFDVIIIDSTDPTAGEGGHLFTKDFYKACHDALKENGVLSAETESPVYDYGWVRMAYNRIKSVFPVTRIYLGFMSTYPSGCWSYTFASKGIDPIEDLDEERVSSFQKPLRYYNAEIHKAAFVLPNFVRELLEPKKG
ncbi:MAG: polyamine aminopropyltransferase [Thermotogae bacterium]|nr:polyamine aminopropyltransferase [Thermotogota bacterium]